MEFTGSWKSKRNINNEYEKFLVKSHVPIINKIFTVIFTTLMWLYTILVVTVFASVLFTTVPESIAMTKIVLKITNKDILMLFLIILLLVCIIFIILYVWKFYNIKRYAHLTRRKYPLPTTDEELFALDYMDKIKFEMLKTGKIIVFEQNPIKELN